MKYICLKDNFFLGIIKLEALNNFTEKLFLSV